MKNKNKVGPIIDPWSTSALVKKNLEYVQDNFHFVFDKKEWISSKNLPGTFNFCKELYAKHCQKV